MKKGIALILVLFVLVCSFAGCGKNAPAEDETVSTTEDTNAREIEAALEAYKKPAEMFDLDLDSYDLSTDEIDFTYSEEGRFLNCTYKIDDNDVFVSYSYDDEASTVSVLVFLGTIVVADETFSFTSGYDRSYGFTEYCGYYFRGLEFEEG